MDSFNSPDEKMTLNDRGFTVCEGNQAGICAPLNLPTVQACLPGPSCFSVLIQTVVTRVKVFTFIQTGFKWVSRTEQINSVHLCTTLRKPLKVWCVQRESESITFFFFSVPKWHFGVQLGFLCANIIRQFQGRMHAEYWRIFIVLHFPCKKKKTHKTQTLLVSISAERIWLVTVFLSYPLLSCSQAVLDFSCQIYASTHTLVRLPLPELREVWNVNLNARKTEQHLIFSRAVAASSSLQPFGSNPSSQPIETLRLAPPSHPPLEHFVSMAMFWMRFRAGKVVVVVVVVFPRELKN